MQQSLTIELNIPQSLKGEPIIYNICRGFDLIPNIIEASFSTDVGWAYITINGEDREIQKLFEYLKNQGIIYKIKAAHK